MRETAAKKVYSWEYAARDECEKAQLMLASLAPKVMKVVGVAASRFDNKGDIKDGGSDEIIDASL